MADVHNQITHHLWGKEEQVELWLANRPDPNVDEELLKRIFKSADLPRCKLVLILDRENGFEGKRGISISWEDRHFATPTNCGGIEDFQRIKDFMEGDKWDCMVYIPKKMVKLGNKVKPYFTLVVGHELEHVRIMREDLEFHRFASWLWKRWGDFVRNAGHKLTMKDYEWPWELQCNKKGKKLALEIHKEKQFTEDMTNAILLEENKENRPYIRFIISLECGLKVDNAIESLHRRILNEIDKKTGMRDVIYKAWEEERKKKGSYANKINLPQYLR